MKNKLITVIGPTAIGKTKLSIALAQYYNCPIISADSRQFYKEMSIGTAVPSPEELDSAKHYFIQHTSIEDSYSVGDFEREAILKIRSLHQNNPIVILVGGSGLYVKAVIDGLDDFPDVDKGIREELNHKLKTEGLKSLQDELRSVDENAYTRIAIDNPHRVIRALEICRGTGRPYSEYLSSPAKERDFDTVYIGLEAERSIVYSRINQRVDAMMESGLLEEAKKLISHRHLNALNTVGYKELFKFLDGKISLDFAISEIKKNTRRFAKRQFTWFKKIEGVKWFDYTTEFKVIINYVDSIIKKV